MVTGVVNQSLAGNPGGWPEEVLAVFERAMTVEFVSLNGAGRPITAPLSPYVGEDGRTLDVSTGLTYPAKAERARRNRKVGLLYADASGSGLVEAPVVLVQGLASVRDRDLQGNTDRYVRLTLAKFPAPYRTPGFLLRQLGWYFARIWIEVTPTRVLWWPSGRLDEAPREWVATAGTDAPASDLAPPGKQPSAWLRPAPDWHAVARRSLTDLPYRDLTVVGRDGFPICVPVRDAGEHAYGFRLRLPDGLPTEGPACLTFHGHAVDFTSQENHAFVGTLARVEDGTVFVVERALGDWSLPRGGLLGTTLHFMTKGPRLWPRLRQEAARRRQPVPKVNLPAGR